MPDISGPGGEILDGADHIAVARSHRDQEDLRCWCAACGQEIFVTSHGWVHRHSYRAGALPIAIPACAVCGRVPSSGAHRADGRP